MSRYAPAYIPLSAASRYCPQIGGPTTQVPHDVRINRRQSEDRLMSLLINSAFHDGMATIVTPGAKRFHVCPKLNFKKSPNHRPRASGHVASLQLQPEATRKPLWSRPKRILTGLGRRDIVLAPASLPDSTSPLSVCTDIWTTTLRYGWTKHRSGTGNVHRPAVTIVDRRLSRTRRTGHSRTVNQPVDRPVENDGSARRSWIDSRQRALLSL